MRGCVRIDRTLRLYRFQVSLPSEMILRSLIDYIKKNLSRDTAILPHCYKFSLTQVYCATYINGILPYYELTFQILGSRRPDNANGAANWVFP